MYPTILGAILAVTPDRETAYPLLKAANALLFAVAAVPVYLVARQLLPTRWSLGVAALSLVIPSSVSASLVMTESAAYAAASSRSWPPCLRSSGRPFGGDRVSWTGNALLLTEFFVARATHVGESDGSLLPSTAARASADGTIEREPGGPLDADAVLAATGVELVGEKLATGTTIPLVLWKVDPPLRLVRDRSAAELRRSVCAAG